MHLFETCLELGEGNTLPNVWQDTTAKTLWSEMDQGEGLKPFQ